MKTELINVNKLHITAIVMPQPVYVRVKGPFQKLRVRLALFIGVNIVRVLRNLALKIVFSMKQPGATLETMFRPELVKMATAPRHVVQTEIVDGTGQPDGVAKAIFEDTLRHTIKHKE